MLERKKLLAGIFIALLSLNICSSEAQAGTTAEKEEARMWGGFRDKVSCTVEGSTVTTTTTEKVVVKEVAVPVYRYPFLFIWDDWYHWGRWHHHHRIYRPLPAPPHRPSMGRPMPRPPKPSVVRPAPRPERPAIGKPVPRPSRPAIGKPASRPPRQEQIGRPSARPNRPAISRQAPQPRPRPQVKSAPRSRDEQMIFQNGGPRGGARHHGGRPGGARPPRGR
ncbi:MAG: hypothetical protein IJ376_03750 [Acidaminococcaceae bacterium]|nr:hypothetical protein [Acidaminococcaceae bacterium]